MGTALIVTNVFLASAAAVKTGYLVNFGRLSEMTEERILRSMYATAAVWTAGGFSLDLAWKTWHGRPLLERAREKYYLFYGGPDILDDLTDEGTATLFGCVTLLLYIVLYAVSFVVKMVK